jgi:hypothetical protein
MERLQNIADHRAAGYGLLRAGLARLLRRGLAAKARQGESGGERDQDAKTPSRPARCVTLPRFRASEWKSLGICALTPSHPHNGLVRDGVRR